MVVRRLLSCCAVVLVLVGATACGNVTSALQQAENTVQSAIDQLALTPGDVQAVLDDTIQKLQTFTDATIKAATDAAKDVLADAAGLVNAVAQCEYDSVGIHVRDALIYIKSKILQKDASAAQPTPWVCLTNPTTVEVAQTSAGGPYQLSSEPNYQIFGFNFRPETLPRVDYVHGSGAATTTGVVAPNLHTAYELDLNLQTVNFAGAAAGDYLVLQWPGAESGSTRIVVLVHPFTAPPPPARQTEQFTVSVHANSGGIGGGECKNIQDDPLSKHTLPAGWSVDQTQGDSGHPGVHQVSISDNQQSKDTLRGYNYGVQGPQAVQVTGTVCGAGWWGPGAIFARQYLVYEIKSS